DGIGLKGRVAVHPSPTVCPARLTSPPPFSDDAAPPWVFCFAYGRQSSYAAACGGGGDAAVGNTIVGAGVTVSIGGADDGRKLMSGLDGPPSGLAVESRPHGDDLLPYQRPSHRRGRWTRPLRLRGRTDRVPAGDRRRPATRRAHHRGR